MKRSERKSQDKNESVDVAEIVVNLFPVHAPEEEKQKNSCQKEDNSDADRVFLHDEPFMLSSASIACQ